MPTEIELARRLWTVDRCQRMSVFLIWLGSEIKDVQAEDDGVEAFQSSSSIQ